MVAIAEILNQQKPLKTIDRIIELGKRGQALLLSGRPGIGKFALAHYASRRFLCQKDNAGCGACFSCRSIDKFAHPDFLLIFPFPNLAGDAKKNTVFQFSDPIDSDAKFSTDSLDEVSRFLEEKAADPYRVVTFKKKSNIPAVVVRDLIKAMAKRPMLGNRRVVVICDVDKMAFGAADLFLKTVEEPPEDSLIILTAPSTQSLPPTLLSRTMNIPLSPVAPAKIRDYLRNQGAEGELEFYINYAAGSPGLAFQAYEDGLIERRDDLWQIFSEFLKERSLPHAIEKLYQRYMWIDFDETRADFDILCKILRDVYVAKLGLDKNLLNIDIKSSIEKHARYAPAADVLQKWLAILARASRVHQVNNVAADIAFVGAFIDFDRAT